MQERRRRRPRRRSAVAMLLFFAFTMPFGIAAHLVSEIAGLGWHDDADVIASPRHAYLAILALVTLTALIVGLARLPERARRPTIESLIDGLPYRGRGAGFAAVSFAAQFAFFALTQLGEGCPLCSGDVVVGIVAAAIAAALGALLVTFGKRRMLAFAFALVDYIAAEAAPGAGVVRALRLSGTPAAAARRRAPFSFRYRPPPFTIATSPLR